MKIIIERKTGMYGDFWTYEITYKGNVCCCGNEYTLADCNRAIETFLEDKWEDFKE